MGARKEGFKKRTVAAKDRGRRIVGAFVKSLVLINELIFYLGGTFEFRKYNVFCCSVNLRPTLLVKQPSEAHVRLFKPLSLIRVLLKAALSTHINSAMYSQKSCFAKTELFWISLMTLAKCVL